MTEQQQDEYPDLFVAVFPLEGLISPPRARRQAMDQIIPMLAEQKVTLGPGRWHWRVEGRGRARFLVAQHAAASSAAPEDVLRRARAFADALRPVVPAIAAKADAALAAHATADLLEMGAAS